MNLEYYIDLAKRVLKKDQRALARLITLIENNDPNINIPLKVIYPKSGHAHLIGITGPPGAGKSTLTDKLIKIARKQGHLVGVICVDPSSPFSGGAILGDRIRMQEHAADAGVFIRSIGTRGNEGGLSRSTAEVATVMDAFGYDTIFIETAGVGQTELGVLDIADTINVVLVPESGDDIQMMKAGILEIANILTVNKSDRQGADHIVKELSAMLEIGNHNQTWAIPVVKCSADREIGTTDVFDALMKHKKFLIDSGLMKNRRIKAAHKSISAIASDQLKLYLQEKLSTKQGQELLKEVVERKLDPYSAAFDLLKK
ncbi:MAG: methylmalonyl Co-A mutase-associated GTPase MeaB [Oligoflexia bacterium]|nr:methylmalonyl Co-A mutase-associated GTPase MeaB [Oligoflexia bacterium]